MLVLEPEPTTFPPDRHQASLGDYIALMEQWHTRISPAAYSVFGMLFFLTKVSAGVRTTTIRITIKEIAEGVEPTKTLEMKKAAHDGCNMSHPTVRRALKELHDLGMIEYVRPVDEGPRYIKLKVLEDLVLIETGRYQTLKHHN